MQEEEQRKVAAEEAEKKAAIEKRREEKKLTKQVSRIPFMFLCLFICQQAILLEIIKIKYGCSVCLGTSNKQIES